MYQGPQKSNFRVRRTAEIHTKLRENPVIKSQTPDKEVNQVIDIKHYKYTFGRPYSLVAHLASD